MNIFAKFGKNMSRLAKKPIKLLEGVTVREEDGRLIFKGPRGEHSVKVPVFVKAEILNDAVQITTTGNSKQALANTGTTASLVKNAILGVKEGFQKVLEIEGVGYKAAMEGTTIVLSLGFVNPIKIAAPAGITITVEKNQIKVTGVDKGMVGEIAATIRAQKKPEPYKGKGIHYQGEVIVRKVGKKAGAAAA